MNTGAFECSSMLLLHCPMSFVTLLLLTDITTFANLLLPSPRTNPLRREHHSCARQHRQQPKYFKYPIPASLSSSTLTEQPTSRHILGRCQRLHVRDILQDMRLHDYESSVRAFARWRRRRTSTIAGTAAVVRQATGMTSPTRTARV